MAPVVFSVVISKWDGPCGGGAPTGSGLLAGGCKKMVLFNCNDVPFVKLFCVCDSPESGGFSKLEEKDEFESVELSPFSIIRRPSGGGASPGGGRGPISGALTFCAIAAWMTIWRLPIRSNKTIDRKVIRINV